MLILRKSLSNVIGWYTKRKIIVIESDDWGSIRTRSKEDLEKLIKLGLSENESHFVFNDALESGSDLENLFEILLKYKDSTGRSPVIAPMVIVANPDFERIKSFEYNEYFYENLFETYSKYPKSNNIPNLWKVGIDNRLFIPGLHGREHINVAAWINGLKSNNYVLRKAFECGSIGVSSLGDQNAPEHMGAFYPDKIAEIETYPKIISEATELFQDFFGFRPTHFVAPNREPVKILDSTMSSLGIKSMTVSKFRNHPLGNGKHGFEFNWIGRGNNFDQIMITRNVSFEPSELLTHNIVDKCIKDIENAFFFKKPAVISSHRVNYIGSINPTNSKHGLKCLDRLLFTIIQKWPDVEFMTSTELGNLIKYKPN
jgi:hypothetical protein